MTDLSESTEWDKELTVAKDIAYGAGEVMRKYFDIDKQQQGKDDGSQVTIADTIINNLVISRLAEAFPDDGVIGEERSTAGYGDGRKWFCDPIDGTWAFITGVPTFMFSLALVVDGSPVVGVAYDSTADKLYSALLGGGAYCNDEKIFVSDKKLDEGILAVTGSARKMRQENSYIEKVLDKDIKTVSLNGAVFKGCLVASGKSVAYVAENLNPYDVVSIHIIVEEAGGKVTDFAGKKLDYKEHFSNAILSNGASHDGVVELLRWVL